MNEGLNRADRAQFYHTMMEATTGVTHEGRPSKTHKKGDLKLENFRMRRTFERLVGDPEMLNQPGAVHGGGLFAEAGNLIGVGTSAFIKVTSELIGNKVIEAYTLVTGVADQLVTNLPTKFRSNNYPGFDAVQELQIVNEGNPYPQLGLQEKFVGSPETHKRGGIVSLTREAVFHDQTDMIILRANQVGEIARYTMEKTKLDAIQDVDHLGTAEQVFLPNGAAEALYRTGGTTNAPTVNLVASNALSDYTDIDAVVQTFIGMTDSESRRIPVPSPLSLLVPEALMDKASIIMNPISIHLNNDGGSTFGTQVGQGGGLHAVRSIQAVLASVHLDARSTSTWYLGNFGRQFFWREHWPMMVEPGTALDDFWLKDIGFAVKVGYYGGMLCLDDKYVIQSEA